MAPLPETPPDPNMPLQLTLTFAEVNQVLHWVGKGPLNDVLALFSKLKTQGDQQVLAAQQAKLSGQVAAHPAAPNGVDPSGDPPVVN